MQACLLTSDGMRRAVKFVNNAPTRTKAQFTAKGNHVYAAIDGHSPPTARAIGYTSSEAAAQSRTCVLTSCRHSSQSSGLIYQSDSIMDSITNFHVRTCRTRVLFNNQCGPTLGESQHRRRRWATAGWTRRSDSACAIRRSARVRLGTDANPPSL